MSENGTQVTVGIMILKDVEDEKKVLLGRRPSYCAVEYDFPDGYLKYKESFDECTRRALKGFGVEIQNIRFQFVSNIKCELSHYVHIGLTAHWRSGEPIALELKNYTSWEWYNIDELPQKLSETCKQGIRTYKTGTLCYDDCSLSPNKALAV